MKEKQRERETEREREMRETEGDKEGEGETKERGKETKRGREGNEESEGDKERGRQGGREAGWGRRGGGDGETDLWTEGVVGTGLTGAVQDSVVTATLLTGLRPQPVCPRLKHHHGQRQPHPHRLHQHSLLKPAA